MSLRITLLHGWGYDATLWREVVPLLDGFDVELCDLGYFGAAKPPAPFDGARIAVGHSLGALYWLALADVPWQRLVAINGFSRFTAAADFPQSVPPRVLERMRRRFAESPATVLDEFRAACGNGGASGSQADAAALAEGLAQLAATDGREALARRAADVWAYAARDDDIVPAAMSEAAFAMLAPGRLCWSESGGHLLPLTHPRECAELIRTAAQA